MTPTPAPANRGFSLTQHHGSTCTSLFEPVGRRGPAEGAHVPQSRTGARKAHFGGLVGRGSTGCGLLSHEVAAWVSSARPLTHLCMAASNQRLEERGRFRPGGPTKSDTTRPGAVRAPLIASQRARALQTSPSRAAHAPRVRVTVAVSPKHLPQLKAISA